MPVAKHSGTLVDEDLAPGDRLNIAFKSTSVTKGHAIGIVVGTGLKTEIGRIARLLAERKGSRTPLQQRLAAFGRRLALVVLAICAVIFVIGLAKGQEPLLMFLTAVSLAVAAIPEALPAVVTVSLAIGARKMSRRNTLIRRLPAVESLGSVTYICADKTGTLTENRMTAAIVHAAGRDASRLTELDAPLGSAIAQALALCNEIGALHERSSDPTETALLEAAKAAGFEKAALLEQLPQIGLLAFDTERKLMTTLHAVGDSEAIAFTKGAPEQVLARCTRALGADGTEIELDREAVERAMHSIAASGRRVLAVARKALAERPAAPTSAGIEAELTLLALVGLEDPVRPEVPQAIAECLSAGITPIMITGDHPETALKIARELRLAAADAPVLTGRDLAELDDEALSARIGSVRIFARVSPEQKIRIVEALQRAGELVAMTGDGVNDAPALKQASIGIAMGRKGTDVARETADMVLLDDNFATIVAAVREGRRVYDNIRKFIKYTMTSNSGEIWVLLLAPLLGFPLPLLPIQILWVNLVTDGLPGLAFSAEPAEPDVMRRPPRPPRESVFARGMWQHMLWFGLLIGGLSLLTAAGVDMTDLERWRTMVFTTLVTAQLFQALAIRSETESLWTLGLLSNRYMLGAVLATLAAQILVTYVPIFNAVFKTVPLSADELALCLGLGFAVLPLVELEKWLARRGLIFGTERATNP